MYKVAILSVLATVNSAWSYHDTSNAVWGAEVIAGFTNYCGTSTLQSPINCESSTVARCPATDGKLEWAYDADIDKFKVTNNGHSLEIDKMSGDDDDSPMKLQNKFVTASGEHKEFCFNGLHMHWGQKDDEGSEHKENNAQDPLEIHFVFYSCDYPNFDTAQKAPDSTTKPTDKYTLAVIGVKFKVGAENSFIKKITDSISKVADHGGELIIEEDDDVTLASLLPFGNDDDSGTAQYYHYEGSLTTPPCTPSVRWHVLKSTMTISAAQLKILREEVYNEDIPVKGAIAPNFRPIQTNTNTVSLCPNASTGDDDGDDDGDDG